MPDHRKALLTRANGLSVAPAPVSLLCWPMNNADYPQVKIVITDVKQSDFEPVIREHVDKPYYLKDVSSQESWRQLPEIPSGAEINDDHDEKDNAISSTLPSNIVTGPWQSKADYIGAQYQLLRHDAIHPLQESVREYKACPWINDNENTLVYTHVRYPRLKKEGKHETYMENRSSLSATHLPNWVQQHTLSSLQSVRRNTFGGLSQNVCSKVLLLL